MSSLGLTDFDPRPIMRAVVVDLDGLLIDSETWSWQAHDRALASFGLPALSLEEVRRLVGLDAEDEWATVQEMRPLDVSAAAYSVVYREAFIDLRETNLGPMPGVGDLLEVVSARGWRLGLASNSGRASIIAALTGLNILEHFAAIASAEDVPSGKPDPAVYQLAMARLGATPERSMAMEDSATGLRAARAAGMYCVAVPNAFTLSQDLSPANRLFPSLREAAEWLDGKE
ncbi:MAG TPA: HAD-IA family hydrolase [Chloroflexota bacterium]|nr:HAD-IA family hydrolase [Chloroflexota bacterium]